MPCPRDECGSLPGMSVSDSSQGAVPCPLGWFMSVPHTHAPCCLGCMYRASWRWLCPVRWCALYAHSLGCMCPAPWGVCAPPPGVYVPHPLGCMCPAPLGYICAPPPGMSDWCWWWQAAVPTIIWLSPFCLRYNNGADGPVDQKPLWRVGVSLYPMYADLNITVRNKW